MWKSFIGWIIKPVVGPLDMRVRLLEEAAAKAAAEKMRATLEGKLQADRP